MTLKGFDRLNYRRLRLTTSRAARNARDRLHPASNRESTGFGSIIIIMIIINLINSRFMYINPLFDRTCHRRSCFKSVARELD